MNILIFLCGSFILCGFFMIFSKKITKNLNASFMFVSTFILFLIMKNKINIGSKATLKLVLTTILFILILSLFYYLLFKMDKYDFTGKILSFKRIFYFFVKPNIKDGRIIGKVLPYNNYQLRYNGKYLVANDIVTAGATLISGSSGSGKTWMLRSFIEQNIDNGFPAIFTEYKGDKKLIKHLKEYAEAKGYKCFILWSDGTANFNYDPLKNINNTGRIESIMNMRKWSIDGSDNHYKTGTQLLLQKLVGDYSHIYEKKENKESYTLGFYYFVKKYNYSREEYDAYNTVVKLLELLITSNLNKILTFKNEEIFDLHKLKNEKFLFIASFVSSNKELATSFTSLLLKDLLDECSNEAPNKNIFLYTDEVGTLENLFIIKDILEKGRSGKIATTLGLQDINQIIINTNDAYLDSLLGTINNFIIFSGCTRSTAEKFAGVQLLEIESIIMNLRKPINGKGPTALYISKYPTLNKRITSEVFRFEPYVHEFKESFNLINNPNQIKIQSNINKSVNEENDSVKLEKVDKNQQSVKDEITEINYNDFI